ncbi:MAG: bifunctional phosphopantothenoylcysteine decarboxylase/phosphopantothenate--cysteine ligase CoaBC [bacterium]|nr:bifunctional phosphopantothenoylcysteine decarboxylase/phosphopantothenate--cysteine ligase CoaBC [bacterium]
MSKKSIVIGVSSGIAAYKILDLITIFKKQGHDVHVMMTQKASHILSPGKVEKLTGHPVYMHLFDNDFSYEQILKQKKVDHIELAKHADIFVIAPATANIIAKLANGLADDFLTTSILATHAPVLICPSMNDVMWNHPATSKNLTILKSYGYELLDPATGSLACGTDGIGRLPEMDVIAKATHEVLERTQLLAGKKIIVTSGGTSEPIDDARVITNRSSGKMGVALAEAAFRYGAEVTLLRSHNSVLSHLPITQKAYASVTELSSLMKKEVKNNDIVIHAAAVSDFTVTKAGEKLESSTPHSITLSPTKKIINEIKKINPKIILIGFKAVTNVIPSAVEGSLQKLFDDAHADYVIVNDISRSDIGFESDENEVYVVDSNKIIKHILKAPKREIANEILKTIFINRSL